MHVEPRDHQHRWRSAQRFDADRQNSTTRPTPWQCSASADGLTRHAGRLAESPTAAARTGDRDETATRRPSPAQRPETAHRPRRASRPGVHQHALLPATPQVIQQRPRRWHFARQIESVHTRQQLARQAPTSKTGTGRAHARVVLISEKRRHAVKLTAVPSYENDEDTACLTNEATSPERCGPSIAPAASPQEALRPRGDQRIPDSSPGPPSAQGRQTRPGEHRKTPGTG